MSQLWKRCVAVVNYVRTSAQAPRDIFQRVIFFSLKTTQIPCTIIIVITVTLAFAKSPYIVFGWRIFIAFEYFSFEH
jgi:hypothetical protein